MHRPVGGRSAGGEADHLRPVHPGRLDGLRPVDAVDRGPSGGGHAHQGPGIGGTLAAHHEHQVGPRGQCFHGGLAIRGGIAQVALAGGPQIGESPRGLVEDLFPLVMPQSGLGDERHSGGIGRGQAAQAPLRIHQGHRLRRLGDGAYRLVVPLVAHIEDLVALCCHAPDFMVDLRHQGTDGIHHHSGPPPGARGHRRRGPVSREHHRGTGRHGLDVVDEDHTGRFEGGHHGGVVNDLVIAVDGGREHPGHPGEGLDGHLHAGAEPARFGQQHLLHHGGHGREASPRTQPYPACVPVRTRLPSPYRERP